MSGVEENGRTVTGTIHYPGGWATMRALILLATLLLLLFFLSASAAEGVVASWLEDQVLMFQSFRPFPAVESREEATGTKEAAGAEVGRPRTGYRMDESMDDVPRVHAYPAHEERGICAGTSGDRGDEDGHRHGDAHMEVEARASGPIDTVHESLEDKEVASGHLEGLGSASQVSWAGYRGATEAVAMAALMSVVQSVVQLKQEHCSCVSQLEQAQQASMAAEKEVQEARADASECLVAQGQAYEKAHSNNQEHERVLERVTAAFTGCQRSFASAMEKVELERARVQIMADNELEYIQSELADCRTSRAAAENTCLECLKRQGQGKTEEEGGGSRAPQHFVYKEQQKELETCRQSVDTLRASVDHLHAENQLCVERAAEATSKQQEVEEECQAREDTLLAAQKTLLQELQILDISDLAGELALASSPHEQRSLSRPQCPCAQDSKTTEAESHDSLSPQDSPSPDADATTCGGPDCASAARGKMKAVPGNSAEPPTALETVDASESSGVAKNIKPPSLTIEREGHRHERGEALVPRVQDIKDREPAVEEVSAKQTAWLARMEAAVASAAAAAVAARDAATAAQKTATAVSRHDQREQEAMIVTHEIELRPCAYLPTDTGKVDGCGGVGVSVVPILYNDKRFFGSESSCVSSAKWNACMQKRRSKRATEDGGGAGGSWEEDGDDDDSTDVLQCWEEAFQNQSTQHGPVACATIARRLQSANCQHAASSLPQRVSLRRSMLHAIVFVSAGSSLLSRYRNMTHTPTRLRRCRGAQRRRCCP